MTDWALYDSIYTERYMGRPADNAAGYRDTAVTAQAKGLRGALLLVHGLADDNVHAVNSLRLADALVAAHRAFDLMVYPDRSHGIGGGGAHTDVFRRILEHFRRNLLR